MRPLQCGSEPRSGRHRHPQLLPVGKPARHAEFQWRWPEHVWQGLAPTRLPLPCPSPSRLDQAQRSGVCLAATSLHLIYLVNRDYEAFEIHGWRDWADVLRGLGPGCQAVARGERVTVEVADRLAKGYRGSAAECENHARFAAALCLQRLIDGDAPDEEEAWARPKGITKSGVRGGPLHGGEGAQHPCGCL